jgi:membrane associated rhomboid family serine protease
MNYILYIANGITMTSTMFCMGYLYQVRWRESVYGKPVLSIMLIVITAVITTLQFLFPDILPVLTRNKEALLSGEWWRLITPLFVQPYGLWQCFFNGCFMIVFLPIAEKLYGKKILLLYFIAGLVGQLFNYLWDRGGGGSSTAIYGVMGSLLIYMYCYRKEFPWPYFALSIAGICGAIVLFFVKDGHAPGLLTGALLGALLIIGKKIPYTNITRTIT